MPRRGATPRGATAAAAVGPGAARRGAWGVRTVRATAASVGPGAARRGAWGALTALGHGRRRCGPGGWGGECYQRQIRQVHRENENERTPQKPRFDL